MPSYKKKVEVPGKSADELFSKVQSDLEAYLSKAGLEGADVKHQPADRKIHIESKMFTAVLLFGEGHVEIDAKLSWLAAPFQSKIDEGITKWLKRLG